ncbi:hypothetical protein DXA97_15365 [Clostridium sp. OF09-36]|uniref:hypothetical protein n=1 Tax=Clostridium sp. OF09-36 TaxID=2292310 RepID=UPI000E4D2ACF|nr:hypothetical protein [Clostridium sp. OF09-36]RHV85814.1 hypothetical protein DXA97_15365 [Clostridium sp. OF09-36]
MDSANYIKRGSDFLKDKMILTYTTACQYLLDMLPEEISEAELQKYFIGDRRDYASVQDIYEQFIHSAQNYQSMPNIIKYDLRRQQIKEILYDFDVSRVKQMDADALYYIFREKFGVTSKDSKRNSWWKWSKSCVEAADFMSNFTDTDDFRKFVYQFDYNKPTRMALPLLISTKISGIGFALACDCLKELGFLNYPKPDVHLIEVFSQTGLSKADPISVFESIVEMAEVCKKVDPEVTPYKIDKIMWLICSGRFYLDDISVGRHKDDFIKYITNCHKDVEV